MSSLESPASNTDILFHTAITDALPVPWRCTEKKSVTLLLSFTPCSLSGGSFQQLLLLQHSPAKGCTCTNQYRVPKWQGTGDSKTTLSPAGMGTMTATKKGLSWFGTAIKTCSVMVWHSYPKYGAQEEGNGQQLDRQTDSTVPRKKGMGNS